jgi:Tfp pilus assembly protein PilX
MNARRVIHDERGIALIVVLLVALVIAVISAGAALVSSNNSLISSYGDKQSVLETVAEAGLEEARSMVNGNNSLYPDSLYNTLESAAQVKDASGNTISGVTRSLYVGPTGITSGQYGVFGSVVSVVEDAAGNKTIRRGEVVQESFAKYAYFTDVEPSTIAFGGGDQIFGPVHTNDVLKIYSSGATFHGPVVTHKTISGKAYGTFNQGYTENGPYIAMPATAQLTKLKTQATAGGTAFISSLAGTIGQATLRIEFVPVDMNGDGFFTGSNEGFIRVYRSDSTY